MPEPADNRAEIYRRELSVLLDKICPVLYRAAYRETGSREDAEDIVQSVLVKVLRKAGNGEFVRNPRGYLYQAVLNRARSLGRSQISQKICDTDIDTLEIAAPAAGGDVDERIPYLRAAMAQLKPEYAEVLKLHYQDGHDCTAIAALCGKSTAAIWVLLCRARTRLRILIHKQEKHLERQKAKHSRDRQSDHAVADGRGGQGSESESVEQRNGGAEKPRYVPPFPLR